MTMMLVIHLNCLSWQMRYEFNNVYVMFTFILIFCLACFVLKLCSREAVWIEIMLERCTRAVIHKFHPVRWNNEMPFHRKFVRKYSIDLY